MSEIVERVANAIAYETEFNATRDPHAIARTAIAAMREPTFEMVMRSLDVPWKNGKTSYSEAYRSMIDAALKAD